MSRSWDSLGLSPPSLSFVSSMGFEAPTPVQAVSIPLFLQHKDVAVEAATGSGKTLAFLLPLVEILKKRELEPKTQRLSVGSVVISPTRELALQTYSILEKILGVAGSNLGGGLFVGGQDLKEDSEKLRTLFKQKKIGVMVGTPGRLKHILEAQKGFLSFEDFEVLVLDEGDRLMALGFEQDLSAILLSLPKQRRTGLFSATLQGNDEVRRLIVKAGLRNPAYVKVAKEGGGDGVDLPKNLENFYAVRPHSQKLEFLCEFLEQKKVKKAVIFFLTCACVDFFHLLLPRIDAPWLNSHKKNVFKLHGQMTPAARKKSYENFKNSKSGLLLGTDLVARGVDFDDIDWIIQFDCPQDSSSFVHRVGRTARAGREGKAIALLAPNEEEGGFIKLLEKRGLQFQELHIKDSKKHEKEAKKQKKEQLGTSRAPPFPLRIREIITSKEREVMVKAQAAFVSYIRAYQEHELKFILALKEVDIGDLALSFALLRIPRVKEILGKNLGNSFSNFKEVHPNSVPFLSKKREEARLEKRKRVEAEMKEQKEEKVRKKAEKKKNEVHF